MSAIDPATAPLVFLGYRAKKPWTPEGWSAAENPFGVDEACSVSDCLARQPPDWIERWDFNRASCYSSAEAAWATVPEGDRASYRAFAYWWVPATTDEQGEWIQMPSKDWFSESLPELPEGPGPTELVRIGFDVVSRDPRSVGWGHSPLSCNHMAKQVPVSRFCLVDRLEDALRLVERWNLGGEGVEPERYCVVAVAAL
jgi:hypothetical protein